MNFDVVIVGASSSGLYAAELLVNAGKRVGAFERQQEINPERRTYIITPQIKEFLSEIPEEAELCLTKAMAVEACDASVYITFHDPDLIIERKLLTKALLSRAISAGAEIFTGYQFIGFECKSKQTKLVFRSSDDEILATTSVVIGADGLKSQVALAAGMALPPSVPIIQAEIKLPSGWNSSVTKVWFDVDDTPYFYWLIPESSDRGVLGLVGQDTKQTRSLLERFLHKLELQALRYQASQVAMHHPTFRPWGEIGDLPIYLIGDAAAQVKVTTVGGTVTGFWGARAAVQAILRGTSYARELRSLKRELDLHWVIRFFLEHLDNRGYADLVRYISPSVCQFLGQRNRDQMAGAFWQLPFHEPRLLFLGLKILLKISLSRFGKLWHHALIKPESGD